MKQVAIVCLSLLVLAGCGAVMGDFSLPDGSTHNDDVSVVNGSIDIGSNCTVSGEIATVNGSVEVGSDSVVGEISAVNGSIRIGEKVSVTGAIENVNGRVQLGAGSEVAGPISTVNGSIRLDRGGAAEGTVSTVNGAIRLSGAEVGGVGTANGDIEVLDGSRVRGRIKVSKSQGVSFGDSDPVRVVIGADSVVEGPLVFEREVELFVHESAEIGDVEGAEPVIYSGDAP
jgi:DUF4097 and DUF4098 domain-containing protein YvlB